MHLDDLIQPVVIIGQRAVVIQTACLQLTHIDLGEFHSDLAAPARRAVEPGGKIENGNVHTVIKWRIGY